MTTSKKKKLSVRKQQQKIIEKMIKRNPNATVEDLGRNYNNLRNYILGGSDRD